MSNARIGDIKMFGGNFAPRSWAFCNGQLLSISQNAALFSILGTTYGGNGQTTFALPDLRGRVPIGMGQGPGLSGYVEGQAGGVENVTLLTSQIPVHNHSLSASSGAATNASPNNGYPAVLDAGNGYAATPNTTMNAGAIGTAGGNQSHTNVQPYLALNFIICLFGIFPSRN